MPPDEGLIDRPALLAAIESRLASGGPVVLHGPSGVGKTTLLARAVRLRAPVIWVNASDPATPYACLADLLRPVSQELVSALPVPQRMAVEIVQRRRDPSGGVDPIAPRFADAAEKSGSATFTWTITDDSGGAVALENPGYQNAYIGRAYTLQMAASGGSGGYRWQATGLPEGLSINSTTGVISGTPTRWGLSTSTVTVTDTAGKSAGVTFGWSVWN